LATAAAFSAAHAEFDAGCIGHGIAASRTLSSLSSVHRLDVVTSAASLFLSIRLLFCPCGAEEQPQAKLFKHKN
jgi:hypothetical protein